MGLPVTDSHFISKADVVRLRAAISNKEAQPQPTDGASRAIGNEEDVGRLWGTER